jgi:hypothetical protein
MSARHILSCILLPAYLSSCTSWQVSPVSPQQAITENQPSQLLVTTTTGHSDVLLEQPRVSGANLVGLPRYFSWAGHVYTAPDTASALSIPLADISRVKVRQIDTGKTVGMFVALVSLGALAIIAHSSNIEPYEPPYQYCGYDYHVC